MDKLPPEILHRIFVLLDLQQRLECLLVCRSWWRILDKYSLFYDINLYNEDDLYTILNRKNAGNKFDDRFNRIINMLEKSLDHAAQVQALHLKPHRNMRKVFNLFPNVRVIKVGSRFDSTDHGELIDITHSNSKVEFLSDIDHCDLASQLLHSNLGSRLRTLCLDMHNAPEDKRNIINQLKNLPVLEKLFLRFPQMSLETLENLHRDIPSIQDFTLEYAYLKAGSLPLDITPATAITKFKYHRGRFTDPDNHITFHQYMTKKYINATNVDYEDDTIGHRGESSAEQIYLNGSLDFFRVIRPSVGKFALHSLPDGINPFEALDIGDSKIQELTFYHCNDKRLFQYLSQSNQFNHVEDMFIESSNLNSIHFLKDMPILTKLRIRYYMYGHPLVFLVNCLAACPSSLKTLVIDFRRMEVEPFQDTLDSIENLDINIVTITSGLGDIISSCFPNLVTLKLTGMVEENVNVTLKHPRLQKATYATCSFYPRKHCNHGFSFQSPHQNETLYYHIRKENIAQVRYENIKELPMLSIKSLTEKKLEVNRGFNILPC